MTKAMITTRTLAGTSGGRIQVELQGSRLLLFTPEDVAQNALWINPHPNRSGATAPWNQGGNRVWISPEIDFQTDRFGNFAVPSSLDPGSWRWQEAACKATVDIATRLHTSLYHAPSNNHIDIDISRKYRAIANPLLQNPHSAKNAWSTLSYIGCETDTVMQLGPVDISPELDGTHAAYGNFWDIIQVPSGGQVLIPVWNSHHAKPSIMFGQLDHMKLAPHPRGWVLRFADDHPYKIAFNAIQSCGRFGYLRQLDKDRYGLLIRQFTVNPSAIYPDYAIGDTQIRGYCMQFYYDGSTMGGFGELEYHAPALSLRTGGLVRDRSQLYYYIGSEQDLRALAEYLLGITSA